MGGLQLEMRRCVILLTDAAASVGTCLVGLGNAHLPQALKGRERKKRSRNPWRQRTQVLTDPELKADMATFQARLNFT